MPICCVGSVASSSTYLAIRLRAPLGRRLASGHVSFSYDMVTPE
jgi:hypothetical protein